MELRNPPPLPHTSRSLLLRAFTAEHDQHNGVFRTTEDHFRPDPELGGRLNGLLFSRRFAGTYNLLLLVILASISVSHSLGKRRQKRQRRQASPPEEVAIAFRGAKPIHDGDYTSSESSSTLTGTETPPDVKHTDMESEHTPLLGTRNKTRRKWTSLRTAIRALMMYQPKPIPVVNKSLPCNATSLAILLFYGLNTFYAFFGIPLERSSLLILSDRFGLMFAVNLPLLYLLAAKNCFVKRLTGYSYEALNIFHRRLGEMMCLLAVLHAVGFFVVWYTVLLPVPHISIHSIWSTDHH